MEKSGVTTTGSDDAPPLLGRGRHRRRRRTRRPGLVDPLLPTHQFTERSTAITYTTEASSSDTCAIQPTAPVSLLGRPKPAMRFDGSLSRAQHRCFIRAALLLRDARHHNEGEMSAWLFPSPSNVASPNGCACSAAQRWRPRWPPQAWFKTRTTLAFAPAMRPA